jgi:UDP-N-acetylglucosamine acyltransferase
MSAQLAKIHPTAVIDPHAELAGDVEIGPYVVVGAHVKIAEGTKIQSHAVIDGLTTIGRGNVIFPFATVGTIPQDLKYRGEPSELVIGNHNQIREFASLNSTLRRGAGVR